VGGCGVWVYVRVHMCVYVCARVVCMCACTSCKNIWVQLCFGHLICIPVVYVTDKVQSMLPISTYKVCAFLQL